MHPSDELVRYGVEVSKRVRRVSLKRYTPLSAPPAYAQVHGRFDDPLDADEHASDIYAVLYCATTPEAAFIEALGGLRAKLGILNDLLSNTLITTDERSADADAQSNAGVVTKDWQSANQLTSGNIVTSASLFDLTSAAAVQTLRFHLAPSLIALGLEDLDFGDLLGTDRNLTQAISRWIWSMKTDGGEPLFSGIRYRSRFDPECICLALYEGRFSVDGDIDTQSITPETSGFAEAASILRLQIG